MSLDRGQRALGVQATLGLAVGRVPEQVNLLLAAIILAVSIHRHRLQTPLNGHFITDQEDLERPRFFEIVRARLVLRHLSALVKYVL